MRRYHDRMNAPEGYAAFAKGKSRPDLAAHYGVHVTLISRWNKEAGLLRNRAKRGKPMPEDFPELAAIHGNPWLCAHYRRPQPKITEWRRECGAKSPSRGGGGPKKPMPVPADFAALASLKSIEGLAKHYRVGRERIYGWLKACPVTRNLPRRMFPPPADFAAVAATMTYTALCRHYGGGKEKVKRWLREAGIKAKERHHAPPKPAPVRRRSTPGVVHLHSWARPIPPRDTSMLGLAAEHLRRITFVYRCGPNGAADPKGEFYRYGNVVLTPDELLQRAERAGFQAQSIAA